MRVCSEWLTPTPPFLGDSSNRTTDTNGQTAMIIGVVIAFIVVVVLLMSIVWLFWFAPDKVRTLTRVVIVGRDLSALHHVTLCHLRRVCDEKDVT